MRAAARALRALAPRGRAAAAAAPGAARARASAGGARGGGRDGAAAPEAAPWPTWTAFPIGVLSGGCGALVGVGGALVMVPLTLRAFALPQLAANSTALLPNVATCAVSGTIFGLGSLGEYVDVPAAALAASAASLAAPPAARLAHRLPVSTQKVAFAAAMLCSAPAVAFKPQLQAALERDEAEVPPPPTSSVLELPSAPRAAYFVALGACVGGASGVMGIGAGTLMTLGLALGGLPSHKAVLGTSFVAQVGPSLSGAWAHHRLGNLRTDLLLLLCAGSACGAAAISGLAADARTPDEALRHVFAAFCAMVGVQQLRAAGRLARRA